MLVEGPNWLNCSAQDLRWFRERRWLQTMPARSSLFADRLVTRTVVPFPLHEVRRAGEPVFDGTRADMPRVIGIFSAGVSSIMEREPERIEPPVYELPASGIYDGYSDDYEFGYEIAA